MNKRTGLIFTGVSVLLLVLITVISSSNINIGGNASSITSVLSNPTVTPVFQTPIRHVIIIVMENAGYSAVIGNNSGTPYQNYLASKYALATQYYATAHPSLPNYLSLIAGSNLGITSDCVPSTCSTNAKSIVDLLNQKGFSWKEYAESMPTNCSQSGSSDGLYYPKHNPFVYFSDITGNGGSGVSSEYCKAHVVPFTQLAIDLSNNQLPNYAFITPNMCNDGHGCSLSTGDRWLSSVVPEIINSSEFASSVLFITYDEGTTSSGANGSQGGGHVACIVISPFAKTGYKSTVEYSHYSLLATVEFIYNLGNLGQNDATAKVMEDIFMINFTSRSA